MHSPKMALTPDSANLIIRGQRPDHGMKEKSAALRIVPGEKKDIPLIRELILELAVYERALPGEAPVTERDLAETLFGARPAAEVLIA